MNNAILNIIQWKRIAFFVFILFLFKFCFLYGYGFKTTLSFLDLSLLSISSVFLLSSGYLTSFFYRNQRKKISINLLKIKRAAWVLLFLGIFIGAYFFIKIQKPWYLLVFIICPTIAYFYSQKNIYKTFFNNIITSVIVSFSILMLWWFDTPINLTQEQWSLFFKLQFVVVIYSILYFLSSIILEIITDIVNINQDNLNKESTLPILLGRKRAKNITLLIAILVCLFIFTIAVLQIKNKFILTTILFLGTIPQLYFIYHLINASSTSDYIKLYIIIKRIVLLAVLSVPIIAYYFKYVI